MPPWLPDIPVFVGLIIVLVICGIFGAINGCVIAFLKVPPLIATLGMQTIVYGLCSVVTKNQPMGGYKDSYTKVANGYLLEGALGKIIPYLAIIALIIGLFMWFLYNKTRHGKYMYAIGGNENAAQVAGVNVPATRSASILLAAVLYALGGFLLGAKAGGVSVQTGFGYELEAIAACTIGGVSTNGGAGNIFRRSGRRAGLLDPQDLPSVPACGPRLYLHCTGPGHHRGRGSGSAQIWPRNNFLMFCGLLSRAGQEAVPYSNRMQTKELRVSCVFFHRGKAQLEQKARELEEREACSSQREQALEQAVRPAGGSISRSPRSHRMPRSASTIKSRSRSASWTSSSAYGSPLSFWVVLIRSPPGAGDNSLHQPCLSVHSRGRTFQNCQ